MPYFLIEDFSPGLDLRKSPETAKPGTLAVLKNGVITPGGEIEKRRRLTLAATLPASLTHGLGFIGNKLHVVGLSEPASVTPLPSFVQYTKLTVVDSEQIVRVHDVHPFGTGLYVVAEFTDGSYRHFFNGTIIPDAEGTNVRPHKSKMYAIDGANLRFSAVKDPLNWTTGTGAGIIDVTTEDQGAGDLVGIEEYYSMLALFGRTSIQLWAMDPDPALNTFQQVLGNIGLVAPNAVSRYGNGDVLFLSHTGIRSLRARDSSNSAVLNDIGSPVDALVQEKRRTLVPADVAYIRALVDPLSGRFWLIWKNQAIVLSLFPNSKVSAWSTFDFGSVIDYATVAGSRVALRIGNNVYVYGAGAGDGVNPFDPNTPSGDLVGDYDDTELQVQTHYIDLGKPATQKRWTGIDVACSGVWEIEANPDPQAPNAWVKIATVTRSTFGQDRIPVDMHGTHIAFRLTNRDAGPARLGALAAHFDIGDEA